MATVVRLVEYSNRETLAILRELLALAIKGEVVGLALCFRSKPGVEQCVFTGPYKANPAEGVNAALRMSLHLTQMQDEMR